MFCNPYLWNWSVFVTVERFNTKRPLVSLLGFMRIKGTCWRIKALSSELTKVPVDPYKPHSISTMLHIAAWRKILSLAPVCKRENRGRKLIPLEKLISWLKFLVQSYVCIHSLSILFGCSSARRNNVTSFVHPLLFLVPRHWFTCSRMRK